MSKKDDALKLAQDLRALADRFSEGWHDGIKLDASDIVLLSDAAEALAEQPPQQQEPHGWKVHGVNSLFMGEFAEADAKAEAKRIGGNCIAFPLYTSPQPSQRSVKPLTDAQIGAVAADIWGSVLIAPQSYQAFARAIEAKLKEKNA